MQDLEIMTVTIPTGSQRTKSTYNTRLPTSPKIAGYNHSSSLSEVGTLYPLWLFFRGRKATLPMCQATAQRSTEGGCKGVGRLTCRRTSRGLYKGSRSQAAVWCGWM